MLSESCQAPESPVWMDICVLGCSTPWDVFLPRVCCFRCFLSCRRLRESSELQAESCPIPCLWVSWLHPGWVPMQHPIAEAQAAACHIPAHGVRPDTGWDVLVLCLSHSSSTLPIGFHRIREWFELKGTFRGHLIQSPSHPHKEQGHLHLHQVLLSQFQTSTFTPPIFR